MAIKVSNNTVIDDSRMVIPSTISAGSTVGTSGSILTSSGTGVVWSVPTFGVPISNRVSATVLNNTDNGTVVSITTGGVTVPSTLTSGITISIWNNSGVAQTITQGPGVTMYNSSDASTGNKNLPARRLCVIQVMASGIVSIVGVD